MKEEKTVLPADFPNDLPEDDQETVISFLDAFIKRRKFEELVQN